MAHPLNRPRLDPKTGRVVEGYGVLQPRVTPPLPGGQGSILQELSSASPASTRTRRPCRTSIRISSGRGRTPARESMTRTPSIGPGWTGAGERSPEPRPLRGPVRARGTGHRRRAVRKRPLALWRRRGPAASMGAWRLAAAAMDPASQDPADRPLEDGGQSAPHLVGPRRFPDVGHRVGHAGYVPATWTMFVLASIAVPPLLPVLSG